MTSKKSLEQIKNHLLGILEIDAPELIHHYETIFPIIEKDLDLLEKLEIENDELKRINGAYQESNIVFQDLIKKFKKAIEILKTKIKMEPYHLPKSRYYHFYIGGRMLLLTKQEYELLKEVLCDE